MPVAFILDFPRGTLEQYDAVVEEMQLGGRLPPGALFHVAGTGPSGDLRVIDVWETDDAFQAFADAQIRPLSAGQGLDPPQMTRFEVAEIRDAGRPRASIGFFQVARLQLDAEGFRAMASDVIGDTPPEGMLFHANGPLAEGGWIVAAGWTTRDARDRFLAERVRAAVEQRGLPMPEIEELEVHNTLEPATAAEPMRAAILGALDQQDAAFNRHDAAGVAALYADDAIVRDQAAGDPMRGRRAVEEFIGGYMAAFPDLRWERVGVEIDGTVGVEQWRASGTHDGDLPGLPATHRQMSIEGCSVLHFGEDGLVHAEENYWDEAAMLRQLGALEPAAVC